MFVATVVLTPTEDRRAVITALDHMLRLALVPHNGEVGPYKMPSTVTLNHSYFASDKGILGLAGLTVTFWRVGSMTRSMSSIAMAPSNT